MHYFTRPWARGEMSDVAFETYSARLQEILPTLTQELADLATDVSLHDGLIRRAVIDRHSGELTLEILIGDNQVGYFDLEITYGGVTWPLLDQDALARRTRDRKTEILQDEIDLAGEGLFEHRLLFWPEDEIRIRFTTIETTKTARVDRQIEFLGDPFVEKGPPGD